ncbi:MAG TPA: efflux RND transporter periplasmic adaptor subunit [Bacteroidales bacterium]|nr:efflux RND transporter periplasmic adaptor subunit [Bacteroidales bacterium]
MMRVFLFTLFQVCIFFLLSCKQKPVQNLEEMARRAARPEAVMVKTVKAEKTTFYHELLSNGKIYSSKKAAIPFKVNGLIRELYVQNGQKVHEGELLAVIEDFEYRTQLQRARQNLEKAEINFRDDILTNFSASDTAGLPSSKIKISRIRSGLDEALTALAQAEYNFNNTRITAPIQGMVADLEARRWNPSQNYKNLCTIADVENMEVEFPVTESEFILLEKGMPVIIIPFVNDSIRITGSITQINPQVDETGMIRIRAAFRNNTRLIDGMNVRVLIRRPVPGAIVVPKESLVRRQGRDVIFIRQDSLAIWRYVTVGAENSSSLSIKEGIEPGDLVIVSGNINLAHETVVKEQ